MARKAEGPWYWRKRRSWHVWIRGKMVLLGKHPDHEPEPKKKGGKWHPPAEIEKAYHEKMAEPVAVVVPPTPTSGTPVITILDEFLSWVQTHKAEGTYESYVRRVQSFVSYLRTQDLLGLTVEDLRPYHVRRWVDAQPNWNPGMKRGRMMIVQRAFNWAVEERLIDNSPIRHMKKPLPGRREIVITPERYEQIRTIMKRSPAFLCLIAVAWDTGARPQELLRVEARHVDLDDKRWVFARKEAKGKKRMRIVHLTPEALAITKRLMEKHPDGKLFRNSDGLPWTPDAVGCVFYRLQGALGRIKMKELGIEPSRNPDRKLRRKENSKVARRYGQRYALVDFRHSFVTRAIKRGVDPVTLANLCGHADTSMVAKIYAHLSEDTEHLKKALGRINQAEDV